MSLSEAGALWSIPIIIDQHMSDNSYSMHDGAIYADCMETIENALNHEFLKACGIASEMPTYIPLPDLLSCKSVRVHIYGK